MKMPWPHRQAPCKPLGVRTQPGFPSRICLKLVKVLEQWKLFVNVEQLARCVRTRCRSLLDRLRCALTASTRTLNSFPLESFR